MDNKYLNEVLDRLENYQKMMRQIELLQYEIQYASHVTPTEMIEVMTFQKRDADNAGTNAYSCIVISFFWVCAYASSSG